MESQAHAPIALSVKHHIVPHIRSCTTCESAWDMLKNLYILKGMKQELRCVKNLTVIELSMQM
mgnify:FL=1